MKQIAKAAAILLLLLPTLLGILYLGERGRRQTALERALGEAMEQTVTTVYQLPYYEVGSSEEMVADILAQVLLQCPAGAVECRLYGVNMDYGFLDLELRLESSFPLLGPIVSKSRQAVIVDWQACYDRGDGV